MISDMVHQASDTAGAWFQGSALSSETEQVRDRDSAPEVLESKYGLGRMTLPRKTGVPLNSGNLCGKNRLAVQYPDSNPDVRENLSRN